MLVLGLMSGTSADGVDAVLADFNGQAKRPNWSIINVINKQYPKTLRGKIIAAQQGLKFCSHEWLELSEEITLLQAETAIECAPKGNFELVGCHGQTLWHRPPRDGQRGGSLQLLKAQLLANQLKRPIIHDFRAVDLALGGQGAPLVAMPDIALLGRKEGWQAILNLGGIANLTLIPPQHGPDHLSPVMGWDCGPANTLIDLAIHKVSKGQLKFDYDGAIAAKGIANEDIIQRWVEEPYFLKEPPKSTGREEFGLQDLERRLGEMNHLSTEDQIATLTNFTSAVIAKDLQWLADRKSIYPIDLIVAGGGSKNLSIMKGLRKRCKGTRVRRIEEYGIPTQAREALAFALLAWWHILRHHGNSPVITGAKHSAVLGMQANPPY